MLLALAVLPLAGPATPAPPIETKEAEARQVLAQIQELDSNLELVIESYNSAQVELDQIVAEQKLNEKRLKIARSNLGTAQGTLEARLVQLYQNGSPDLVEILLGSSSLDEILDGIETASRVSDQDTQILDEVRKFREEIKQREAELEKARGRQEQVVAERAAKRQEIEATLAQRQQLLSSIKDQIAELKAEERRRQERLEAAAEARLDTQSGGGGGGGGGGPVPSAKYGGVVGIAMQYLGIPYQWGGESPSTGFDCSGFTYYVFSRVGVSLPAHGLDPVRRRRRRLPLAACARRPRLLQRPRPRRHLHRRQPVHPLAAHGRRREDLGDDRLLLVHVRGRAARPLAGASWDTPARRLLASRPSSHVGRREGGLP